MMDDRRKGEAGMTMLAIMLILAVAAIALMAAAPAIQQEVQREKELEAIQRGEDIANAIRLYVEHYNGTKLPESIDDLLEGIPQGTKTLQIMRPSSAVDPLSEDGKWRLIKADPKDLATFAKRVQDYNNGLLPSNPSRVLDRYSLVIVNSINTDTETSITEPDTDISTETDNTPFIGVGSQSTARSVLSYYGQENHSKWIFTPLFRGDSAGPTGRRSNAALEAAPAPER
jgi:type II secretory pathway pseudopilin PulG